MPLDISRALRSPGDSFPFLLEEQVPAQEVLGDLVRFDPLRIEGSFTLQDGKLRLEGTMTGRAEASCANCLQPASYPLDIPFDEVYTSREEMIEPEPLEDGEMLVFDGPLVDLAPLALTLSLLELPLRFLCREDCQGLLNVTPLTPAEALEEDPYKDHPFAALQVLLKKDLEV